MGYLALSITLGGQKGNGAIPLIISGVRVRVGEKMGPLKRIICILRPVMQLAIA
jgi:hypothetical protein